MFDVKRQPNENEQQYLWRLGNAKDSGILDMNWSSICSLMNSEFADHDRPFGEAAWRKPYQMAKKFYDAGVFRESSDDKQLKELQLQKQELQKETVKVRDERNELRRVIREEARKESYKDQIIRSISEYQSSPLAYDENKKFTGVLKSDNDLVISLTDIHAGIEIDNYFNKYNQNILKERLDHYLDKIFEVQVRHGSQNAYVILSELVSGIIHNELRIENNQNLIEQFLTVTDYISQFLSELCYHFNMVDVFICPGNHSRISPKKEDSLKGENIDHLALPFLEAKLKDYENILFHKNDVEESIAIFNARGNNIFCSHGDKDDPTTVVQKYTLMFGIKPNIIYLGHRHTNAMSTVYNVKVIQSGCLSGIDNYCLDKRLMNYPEQTISVITRNGLDCLYDVKFKR